MSQRDDGPEVREQRQRRQLDHREHLGGDHRDGGTPGARTLAQGLSAPPSGGHVTAADTGPIQLPEGLGAASSSPYTQAQGEDLGFGADHGPGDMAAAPGGVHGSGVSLPEGFGSRVASPYTRGHGDYQGFGAELEPHDRVAAANASPASSLPAAARSRFEASLGGSLAEVRVHDGPASAKAASSMGARAFAVGQDIHFGEGQYAPGTAAGDHLMAHEVAHTRQQVGATAAVQRKAEVGSTGDSAELEADVAADAMVAGLPAFVSSAPAVIRLQTATAALRGASANGVAALVPDRAMVMFGASEIYQAAPEQVVTLTNRDRAPHHIRAASLAGANMGDFEVRPAQRIPVTLEPDASLELRLAFAPQAEGYRTANVAVLSPPLQDTRILVGGMGQGVQQAETSQSTNPKGGPQAPAPAGSAHNCGPEAVDPKLENVRKLGADGFETAANAVIGAVSDLGDARQRGIDTLARDIDKHDAPKPKSADWLGIIIDAAIATVAGSFGTALTKKLFGETKALWKAAAADGVKDGFKAIVKSSVKEGIKSAQGSESKHHAGWHYPSTLFLSGVKAGVARQMVSVRDTYALVTLPNIRQQIQAEKGDSQESIDRVFDEYAELRCYIKALEAGAESPQFLDALQEWCVSMAQRELGTLPDGKDAEGGKPGATDMTKVADPSKAAGAKKGMLDLKITWSGQLRSPRWHQEKADEMRRHPQNHAVDRSPEIGTGEYVGADKPSISEDLPVDGTHASLPEPDTTGRNRNVVSGSGIHGGGVKIGPDGKIWDYYWRERKDVQQGVFKQVEYVEEVVKTVFQPHMDSARVGGLNEPLRNALADIPIKDLHLPMRIQIEPGNTVIARNESGDLFAVQNGFLDAFYEAVVEPTLGGKKLPRERWLELAVRHLVQHALGRFTLSQYIEAGHLSEVKG